MLTGQKVTLRPYQKEDLPRIYQFENDVELRLLADNRPMVPQTMAQIEAWFERRQTEADPQPWFAIEADGLYIGKCGLHNFHQADQTCDLGIEIGDRAYWGQGYGREAIILLLDYAFRLRNVRKVCLVTSSHNLRAIRAYEAVGFAEEGRQIRQQWVNGRYVDYIFMGIFREAWQNRQSAATAPAASASAVKPPLDEIAVYNRERWNALVQADIEYSRPYLDLDVTRARQWLAEKTEIAASGMPEVAGKEVLVLAGGGGQQTAVFGLLDAHVTVIDLSDGQLAGDRQAAAYFGYNLQIEQGDMRDLSRFASNSFDIVWQPYSINFVPDAAPVIAEVSRIIRPGGFYNLDFSNPYWSMEESDWLPQGYPVGQLYQTGEKLRYTDTTWQVADSAGKVQNVAGPHEFLHTLGTLFNALVQNGFVLTGFREEPTGDPDAEPGTWEHLCAILPPFWQVTAIYHPGIFR